MTQHIFIYGQIGNAPGETSMASVKAQLNPNATDYIMHINSPGGEVFEGFGIYNLLKNAGKPIEAHIESVCASIATLIVAAADKIVMNRASQFMIHNPHITNIEGDANKLRNVATQLDNIKTILIDAYKKRTKLSQDKLWELYDNETWLTADQAAQMGFVDEAVDAIKAVARVDLNNLPMEKKTLFQKLRALLEEEKPEPKNEFTETLADGRVIIVMSEDEDWTGKQIVYEDGSPLEPGDYQLLSGKVITVGDNSTIAQVGEAPAPQDNQNSEMQDKISALEQQLAEAKAAQQQAEANAATAQKEATTATATASRIENRLKDLEKKFLALSEEASKTVGSQEPIKKGPVLKNVGTKEVEYDPMGEEALKFFRTRNMIPHGNED